MARRGHGGLGRGLDALIPRALQEETKKQENNSGGSSAENSKEDSGKREEAAFQAPSEDARKETAGTDPENTGTSKVENRSRNGNTDPDENAAAAVSMDAAAAPGTAIDPTPNPDAGSGSVQMLRLSQVDPNRSQPRSYFADEALEELADSIRQFGVIQPILVQKKGSRYEIIAGERRWRASRKAGLKEIPAIVREYSDQETVELSLIENIQREDLNPIEEAQAYRRLQEEFGLRQEDLAARVSKSRTAITNALRLLKLDDRVQDMIIQGQISMGHARALLPVEIPDEQFLLAQEVAEKHLSVRDVEKMIKARTGGRKKKTGSALTQGSGKTEDPALELAYRDIEERLKQSLGTRAVIRHGGNGTGKLEIEFYSHEDLEKIVDLLT